MSAGQESPGRVTRRPKPRSEDSSMDTDPAAAAALPPDAFVPWEASPRNFVAFLDDIEIVEGGQ